MERQGREMAEEKPERSGECFPRRIAGCPGRLHGCTGFARNCFSQWRFFRADCPGRFVARYRITQIFQGPVFQLQRFRADQFFGGTGVVEAGQILLGSERKLFFAQFATPVSAVRLKFPGIGVVAKLRAIQSALER